MKIQIASDLHIEYYYKEDDYYNFIKPEGDILILAGDIGSIYRTKQLFNFLNYISKEFKYVIYIFGNCEFYLCNKYKDRFLMMDKLKEKVFNFRNSIPNLFILDRTSIVVDNYLISGCTLWSELQNSLP